MQGGDGDVVNDRRMDSNPGAGRNDALLEELTRLRAMDTFPLAVQFLEAEIARREMMRHNLFNQGGVRPDRKTVDEALSGPLSVVIGFFSFRELHRFQRTSCLWRDICRHHLAKRLRPVEQRGGDFYLFHHPELPATFENRDRDRNAVINDACRNAIRHNDAAWMETWDPNRRQAKGRNYVATITFRTTTVGDTSHMCLLCFHGGGGFMIDLRGPGIIRCHHPDGPGDDGYARRSDLLSPGALRLNDSQEHTLKAIMEYPYAFLMIDGRVVAHHRVRFNQPYDARQMLHPDTGINGVQVGCVSGQDRNFVGELQFLNIHMY